MSITPKLPACCSKCDVRLRDIKLRDEAGIPRRFGRPYPGSRRITLVHLDGTISDHSLCKDCVLTLADLRLLWDRAVLLYREGIGEDDRANPCHAAYERNLPIGILSEVTL